MGTKAAKTCLNCEHRRGDRCVRTGFYCDIELAYGGHCAGERGEPPEYKLWEPRKSIWLRLLESVKGVS